MGYRCGHGYLRELLAPDTGMTALTAFARAGSSCRPFPCLEYLASGGHLGLNLAKRIGPRRETGIPLARVIESRADLRLPLHAEVRGHRNADRRGHVHAQKGRQP